MMSFYLFTLSYELLQMALAETLSRIFFDLKIRSHFIISAVDSSLWGEKKEQKNWFSTQRTQKDGVSSCHSAGTQLVGLSHGVMCFSQGVVVSVSSIDSQGVGSRGSHTAVKQRNSHSSEAEHRIFLLSPAWMDKGTALGALCSVGSFTLGRGGPAALPALPTTAVVPTCPSWHISALQRCP